MLLEVEFNKNPTPDCACPRTNCSRHQYDRKICADLVPKQVSWVVSSVLKSTDPGEGVQRSRTLRNGSIESGEDCDSIPESMRHYLAMQQYGPGKGMSASLLSRTGPGLVPYGSGMLAMNGDNGTGKVVIQHFACRSLSIGTWRRVGQSTMDLVIFYSPGQGVRHVLYQQRLGWL